MQPESGILQRYILGIRWYDGIRDTDIPVRTKLPPVMDLNIRKHSSLFRHISRLGKDSPAA